MSKINFEQIHEDVVEVTIPPETPMEMVQQLTKSLVGRGLVEDLANSTLAVRYFVRPSDSVNDVADKLIKSLKNLAKEDELPYWHPKMQMAHQKKMREQAIAERRSKVGATPNTSAAPTPNAAPKAPAAPAAPATPKMYDSDPKNQNTAGGTGKRYAYIKDPVAKMEEHDGDCDCGQCEEIEKSNYGPRGMGQYSVADNARRKMNNTGDMTGFGHNVNTKAYSTKPGQLSGKAQAGLTARIQAAANKKQPVKQWTAEQIAEENAKRGLKKGWANHNSIPSAEEEIMKLAQMEKASKGDDAMANQLAKMMQSKAMFSNHQQPSSQEFEAAGEAMGMGVSEEMAKNAEQQWNGALNNWLAEATKPISQRFSSEEEELAYWAKIKVTDSGNDSGY